MRNSKPLYEYKKIVESQPQCDSSFKEIIRRARTNQQVRRRISAAFLKFALELAEKEAAKRPAVDLFDLIQEANGALYEAIVDFGGTDPGRFRRFARRRICRHLRTIT